MATATKETSDMTILGALTRYLEGQVQRAREEGDSHIDISTVDVQTRIASRCREMFGVTALPVTWARKFRVLRNDSERLQAIGISGAHKTPDHSSASSIVVRFDIDA